MKILIQNKKAYFNYQILEEFEAGLVLNGQEVKSIKSGRMNLQGSYATLKNREKLPELYLIGAYIPAYQPKNAPQNYNPERSIKLLLNKSEIRYLIGKTKEKGLTLVPLKVYLKNAKVKIAIGLAKGKKKSDKREAIKKREAEREIRKALKI
jgi:SsrA-binding protein